MLEGWEGSEGATREREVALAAGIPVFVDLLRVDVWVEKKEREERE
jgi:hypothetical protein